MRIAFTSCCDPINDPVQRAWDIVAAKKPQHLVLLGDNIYMDYGFGDHLGNGEPKGLPPAAFSALMHGCYARQWAVPAFRRAITGVAVHAIWDDHDFAWNKARGGGPVAPEDRFYVPASHRKISRRLFQQFREALIAQPDVYPPNPCPQGQDEDLGSIETQIQLEPGLTLHLLDGRTSREAVDRSASLLGVPQRDKLNSNLLDAPGINLLASGSTLKDWEDFSDFEWLEEASKQKRLLVLSGDIHKPAFRKPGGFFRRDEGNWFEATASAMGQPPKITGWIGKKQGVFGVLDVNPTELDITLWHEDEQVGRHVIDRAAWTLR